MEIFCLWHHHIVNAVALRLWKTRFWPSLSDRSSVRSPKSASHGGVSPAPVCAARVTWQNCHTRPKPQAPHALPTLSSFLFCLCRLRASRRPDTSPETTRDIYWLQRSFNLVLQTAPTMPINELTTDMHLCHDANRQTQCRFLLRCSLLLLFSSFSNRSGHDRGQTRSAEVPEIVVVLFFFNGLAWTDG